MCGSEDLPKNFMKLKEDDGKNEKLINQGTGAILNGRVNRSLAQDLILKYQLTFCRGDFFMLIQIWRSSERIMTHQKPSIRGILSSPLVSGASTKCSA